MKTVNPNEVDTGFKILTGIDEEQYIVSEVQQVYKGEIIDATETIINTKDAHVRQCLIALGWTPPT